MKPKRVIFAGLPAALALLALGVLGAAVRLAPLPGFWSEALSREARPGLTTVLDRNGRCVAVVRTAGTACLPVRLDAVDPLLVQVTLAAEDRRFTTHRGIDPLATARALGQNLRAGRRISGGSTLTQQVVKILLEEERHSRSPQAALPPPHPSLTGKLRQAYWALVLESHLSKDRILEAYFNHASYGATIQGLGAACCLYFGHAPDHVTLEEAALLAALPQSPVRLDPRGNPEPARRARNRVLARTPADPEERAAATSSPLRLSPPPPSIAASPAPHWITHALHSLPACREIRLPLDPALQETARRALDRALGQLTARGADDGAVVILNNPTGEIRAWIGSPDWKDPGHGQFDAALALRQPGSALKPFTYALAFDRGLRPNDLLPDLPTNYGGLDGSYRPHNYSGAYHGPVRARMALANSWNAPAVAVLARLGPEELLSFLRSLGITSLDRSAEEYGLGLTLGDGEVSLLELTTAYSCLARGGRWLPRIEVLESRSPADQSALGPEQRISPTAAFWVNSILSDEHARALAFGEGGPFDFPFPVAIKTGTSSDWRDNWAFGATARWTVGVWVGAAAGAPMDRVSGTRGAILALREILLRLGPACTDSHEEPGFAPPSGMESRTICALSGRPAGPDCPERVSEWFLATEPVGPPCAWHRRIALDLMTGLLARPCTPPERVREVLYTLPDAADLWGGTGSALATFATWVRDQGWPFPPEELTDCLCGKPDCGTPTRDSVLRGLFAVAHPSQPERDGDPASRALHDFPEGRALLGRASSPALPRCRITHPVDGAVYALDASLPADQQELALEGAGGPGEISWTVDGREIGRAHPGERLFWRLQAGRHRIRAEQAPARADEVVIEVEGTREPVPRATAAR